MKIGVFPRLWHSGGGVYQYSLCMLRALYEWVEEGSEHQFVIFRFSEESPPTGFEPRSGWEIVTLQAPEQTSVAPVRKILRRVPYLHAAWTKVRQHRWGSWLPGETTGRRLSGELAHLGLDLIIYPVPTMLSFELGIPFVMAVHDLQHRLQPEFPEVSAHGEWEAREHLFSTAAKQATLLLAESPLGKQHIIDFYSVEPDRVRVLPLLPASYLRSDVSSDQKSRVTEKYDLPPRYLFYPAQFWPHKNHLRLIEAMSILKGSLKEEINLVLCGSAADEIRAKVFSEVMDRVRAASLSAQVHYLGFVPDEDMSGIYARADALVMPTFFGPTNIPVLEAWGFGCPVLTSDIPGIKEQVGDAGVLVDPRSAEDIAEGLRTLWEDAGLRRTLADKGRQRLQLFTPKDYRDRLISIIADASSLVELAES